MWAILEYLEPYFEIVGNQFSGYFYSYIRWVIHAYPYNRSKILKIIFSGYTDSVENLRFPTVFHPKPVRCLNTYNRLKDRIMNKTVPANVIRLINKKIGMNDVRIKELMDV